MSCKGGYHSPGEIARWRRSLLDHLKGGRGDQLACWFLLLEYWPSDLLHREEREIERAVVALYAILQLAGLHGGRSLGAVLWEIGFQESRLNKLLRRDVCGEDLLPLISIMKAKGVPFDLIAFVDFIVEQDERAKRKLARDYFREEQRREGNNRRGEE